MIDRSSAGVSHTSLARGRRPIYWRAVLLAVVIAAFAGEQIVFVRSSLPWGQVRAVQPRQGMGQADVAALVADALGPSDRGVTRLRLVGRQTDPRHRGMYSLNLTWAINGDLSLGSVSAGAELDVYLVLRALYTAHLPLGAVRMTGTFGELERSGHHVETPVMIVGMDAATARLIDWQDMDAAMVWPLVHRYMMQPGFECQCQE